METEDQLSVPPASVEMNSGPGLLALIRALTPFSAIVTALLKARPTEEDLLRVRLLRLEVAKAEGRSVTQCVQSDPVAFCEASGSLVFVGAKGTGKTVAACSAADIIARAMGVEVLGVDWPKQLLPGSWRSVSVGSALVAKDAVVIMDESVLRLKKGAAELWGAMALARQRNVRWIWTTQALSGVDIDVLRQGVVRCWFPGASEWEREEVREEAAAARLTLRVVATGRLGVTVTVADGLSLVVSWPLPPWWSEAHSKLWR